MCNCTCTSEGIGDSDCLESDGNDLRPVSCAVFNNDDDFTDAFPSGYPDFCASDDGDDGGTDGIDWTSEATDWANNFTDYANGDFSVKDASADIYLAGASQNDYSYVPSDDIIGTARPTGASQPSIGAFELAAAGPTQKSVAGAMTPAGATTKKAVFYRSSGGSL